jgi:hypothetical protein
VGKDGVEKTLRACRATRGIASVPTLLRGGNGMCFGHVPFDASKVEEVDGVSLFPIEKTGMGLVAIHRDVLEAMTPHVYEVTNGEPDGMRFHAYFTETIANSTWVGEDYNFCNLACNLGFRVDLVLDVEATHAGRTCKLGKDLFLSVGDQETADRLARAAKKEPAPSP